MGKNSKFFITLSVVLLLIFVIFSLFRGSVVQLRWDQFLSHLDQGHIEKVEIGREEILGKLKIPERAATAEFENDPPVEYASPDRDEDEPDPAAGKTPGSPFFFSRKEPKVGQTTPFVVRRLPGTVGLEEKLDAAGVEREGMYESNFMLFLPFILIAGFLLLFWFLMLRQSQAGRTAMSFGRSRAKLYAPKLKPVTFEDVAGCEEAEEELSEVVDFLKNPKKYQTLGGRMPKGILLVGPPGTGKTLIARAVAGEAKRPFFSLSGSEFVEMFVGVGAARVRDLFQQAKENSPCIVFIDELDAVGRHRGAGLGGGHDEREQTLNQLLVEMDGFDANTNVIILAATNRPDVLDPALLRPGRFDRQVVIDAPDLKGREAILDVHAKEKPFANDINLEKIAVATPGFTGADLANVLNEAALLAARRNKEKIGHPELEEATERIIAGPERKSRRLSGEERRRVAYHEAGHALVAALSEHADPVRKISIIPRGVAALGYTMQFPSGDRHLMTRSALVDRLKSLLAGRAAERLIFDEMSTGAQDDLNKASEIAHGMVCRYGMSDRIGPVALGRERRQVFLGRDLAQEERNYSEETAIEIDKEVRLLIEEADGTAVGLLKKHRKCLESIAEMLLDKEALQGEDLDEILEKELESSGVRLPHIERRRKEEAERAARAKEAADKATDETVGPKKETTDEKPPESPTLKEGWAPSS